MGIVKTDLRVTREAAERIRFYPVLPFTATNVQDAITESASIPPTIVATPVTFAMSPYTPAASDQLLLVNTAAGPVTIAMPAASARSLDLEIKDDTGNAFANNISITFTSGQTADGLSPYVIDGNYGAVKLGPQSGGYFVHA